ncbi:MAG: anthranilate synthase component I [Hyphomicrobiales bacterium]|nr:anthranilate synthase component I [Hyphomicrobiales bacterium]
MVMASTPGEISFTTRGGVKVRRTAKDAGDGARAILDCRQALDERRGAVFSSNYEYPGRYTRWDVAFIDPALSVTARGREVEIAALNGRGRVLLPGIVEALAGADWLDRLTRSENALTLEVRPPKAHFTEEERIRQSTAFSAVRALIAFFANNECAHLGLYGAFGYDLAFQFDPIRKRLGRPDGQRDIVLFLPDEIIVVDHYAAKATRFSYEFEIAGRSTKGLKRGGTIEPFRFARDAPIECDHAPGEYAGIVSEALSRFKRGDLFEVVPGQSFFERCAATPSAISIALSRINPAPYGFMINLGMSEYLVGASPEMFVRVTGGRRIETCPISGTISRGADAISDAEQVRKLLNSAKDEAELTMCSDVDRNDKSRVCEPGSVRMIGRRQIEMYSRLIHTVDHIEGRLLEGLDALDGFLSHAWAVTVTGAPKRWAMQFIEDHERSPRAWYGGAIGMVHFNGDLNTGLTLRTIRIKDGIAEVRAGATLLADSDPEEEERETRLKASAMLAAIREAGTSAQSTPAALPTARREPLELLLIDHDDSFVHTLAGYFRQCGARVTTLRAPVREGFLDEYPADLVVLSPGPARPSDFNMKAAIMAACARSIPLFGVCLGLQGIAEAHGAVLRELEVPMHGKPSRIRAGGAGLFAGVPSEFAVGRYHSLVVDPSTLPPALAVTARTQDGVVMAIEHQSLPIAAVQFHPESMMTLGGEVGLAIIENVMRMALKHRSAKSKKGAAARWKASVLGEPTSVFERKVSALPKHAISTSTLRPSRDGSS